MFKALFIRDKLVYYTNEAYEIEQSDVYAIGDTLLMRDVHGGWDGTMSIRTMNDINAPYVPVTPEQLEERARDYGYSKWAIMPCYPTAVKARYPQIAHRIIGHWNLITRSTVSLQVCGGERIRDNCVIALTPKDAEYKSVDKRIIKAVDYAWEHRIIKTNPEPFRKAGT